MKEPSEEFNRACEEYMTSGGSRRTCECGMTFYNPDGGWDWNEGELEELQAKEERGEATSVGYTVTAMSIDGKEFVIGCPCNGLRQYEDFIWAYRELSALYIRNRAKTQLDEAHRNMETSELLLSELHDLDEGETEDGDD